jgi:hypothetical protein
MQAANKKRFFEANQHHRSNVLIYGTELEKLHPRHVEQKQVSAIILILGNAGKTSRVLDRVPPSIRRESKKAVES